MSDDELIELCSHMCCVIADMNAPLDGALDVITSICFAFTAAGDAACDRITDVSARILQLLGLVPSPSLPQDSEALSALLNATDDALTSCVFAVWMNDRPTLTASTRTPTPPPDDDDNTATTAAAEGGGGKRKRKRTERPRVECGWHVVYVTPSLQLSLKEAAPSALNREASTIRVALLEGTQVHLPLTFAHIRSLDVLFTASLHAAQCVRLLHSLHSSALGNAEVREDDVRVQAVDLARDLADTVAVHLLRMSAAHFPSLSIYGYRGELTSRLRAVIDMSSNDWMALLQPPPWKNILQRTSFEKGKARVDELYVEALVNAPLQPQSPEEAPVTSQVRLVLPWHCLSTFTLLCTHYQVITLACNTICA